MENIKQKNIHFLNKEEIKNFNLNKENNNYNFKKQKNKNNYLQKENKINSSNKQKGFFSKTLFFLLGVFNTSIYLSFSVIYSILGFSFLAIVLAFYFLLGNIYQKISADYVEIYFLLIGFGFLFVFSSFLLFYKSIVYFPYYQFSKFLIIALFPLILLINYLVYFSTECNYELNCKVFKKVHYHDVNLKDFNLKLKELSEKNKDTVYYYFGDYFKILDEKLNKKEINDKKVFDN